MRNRNVVNRRKTLRTVRPIGIVPPRLVCGTVDDSPAETVLANGVVHNDNGRMPLPPRPHIAVLALVLPLLLIGCDKTGGTPKIKQIGVFTQSGGTLVEMPKLGTLGMTYGPHLYPELPEYDIPVVGDVGPMYVNIPDFPVSTLKGVEWHGYRLGGNTSAGTPSTATPKEWKFVPVITEQTKTPGLFKVLVSTADAKTGRWKPELEHEYFGLTIEGGIAGSPVWAVHIK
jgi:hypothetical protein